jgi:hypothetical protein
MSVIHAVEGPVFTAVYRRFDVQKVPSKTDFGAVKQAFAAVKKKVSTHG